MTDGIKYGAIVYSCGWNIKYGTLLTHRHINII